MDDLHDTHQDGAAATLRSIHSGGQHLLIIARQRVSRLLDELEAGDFRAAYEASRAVSAAIAPLAQAQAEIAIADGARLVIARDITVGMMLQDIGEVTAVDVRQCGVTSCEGHVTLTVGEGRDVEIEGDAELYVTPPRES